MADVKRTARSPGDELQVHRCRVEAADHGRRLDRLIAALTGWSRKAAQVAIADGAVYVDGKRCRVQAQQVATGAELVVQPASPDRTHIDGGVLRIVAADPALLVVAKPAGLPSQPPPRGGDALSLRVAAWLAANGGGGRPYVGEVHRLDRDASGLVVYGRNRAATGQLAAAFREHRARRDYLALVRTAVPVPPMTIEEPIAEEWPGRMAVAVTGAPACSHVRPLCFDAAKRIALVGVSLETGRTHQVRVHLAWAVGPIIGDQLYGDPHPPSGRIGLHAARLSLPASTEAPSGTWQLDPDEDFWRLAAGASVNPVDGWLAAFDADGS